MMATREHGALHLAWCVGGVISSLVAYGVLQERLMQHSFRGERFTYSLLLVLCNRVCACILSTAPTWSADKKDAKVHPNGNSRPPLTAYMLVSMSNVLATYCQYEALHHVSFAAQTLGKCSKMPVAMLWGMIMLRARYGFRDVVRTLSITMGATLFLLWPPNRSSSGNEQHTAATEVLLMLGYLAADGFTSSLQDRLFRQHGMPVQDQVLCVSGCSAVLALGALAWSGQLVPAVLFLARNLPALLATLLLGLVASVGQIFITATIRGHGAVVLSGAMTTRQVCSLLLSSLIFGPAISARQLAALALVFGAMYDKLFERAQRARQKKA